MSSKEKCNFSPGFFDELEELRNHYLSSHQVGTSNPIFNKFTG